MIVVETIPLPPTTVAELEGFIAEAEDGPRGFLGRLSRTLMPAQGKSIAARALAARKLLAGGTCQQVHLSHVDPPAIMTHEHGILVFSAVDPARTLLLEISSAAEDTRWELNQRNALFRREWRWVRFPLVPEAEWGMRFDGFVADGPEVKPVDLGDFHETPLEVALTQEMDWPGDDVLLDMPMSRVTALAQGKR